MIKLYDLLRVIDSESEVKIMYANTQKVIIKGIRGMVDNMCIDLDCNVTHIVPGNVTDIWVDYVEKNDFDEFEVN